MSEFDSFGVDKSLGVAKSAKGKGRAYVKDADLQIHIPSISDAKNLEDSKGFKNIMGQYLDEVNTLQHEADAQIQRLIAGETEDLHEVTLAMDEAETSFELMMEIRNKLMDAYREIMRMQS